MNVADQLSEVIRKDPYKRSVIMPSGKDLLGQVTYSHYTFCELENRINQLACALRRSP